MQRIRLFRSHKILLQEKTLRVREAIRVFKTKQVEFQSAFNLMKEELGIPQGKLNQWKLSEDEEAIEKIEPEKPPKNKKKEGE